MSAPKECTDFFHVQEVREQVEGGALSGSRGDTSSAPGWVLGHGGVWVGLVGHPASFLHIASAGLQPWQPAHWPNNSCISLCLPFILFSNCTQPRKFWLPTLSVLTQGLSCLISWTNTILRRFSLDTMARIWECHGFPFRPFPPPIPPPLPSDVKLLKINIPFGFRGLSFGLVTFASGLEGSCEFRPACGRQEGAGREAAS